MKYTNPRSNNIYIMSQKLTNSREKSTKLNNFWTQNPEENSQRVYAIIKMSTSPVKCHCCNLWNVELVHHIEVALLLSLKKWMVLK